MTEGRTLIHQSFNNLSELIFQQAERHAERTVFLSTAGRTITYSQLARLLANVKEQFLQLGVSTQDRVAIVLPNGPELALAFLSTAACAACAPLNPNYSAVEFGFFLEDLKATRLILLQDDPSAARQAAVRLGIPVIDLIPDREGDTIGYRLHGEALPGTGQPDFCQSEDICLLLHTSGTTSRPKLVPLSQANILSSAGHIVQTLSLSEADRCINIMPLFHIHGLIAIVVSSVMAGASAVCLPGFQVDTFFGALQTFHPTWYSAVPTIHQAVLEGAGNHRDTIQGSPLRLIRSSSAALPALVMAELEKEFGCPVVEAYGMTEASHQMASNPLPPLKRKPNSVGLPAGPEIAIVNEGGRFLGKQQTGEIVIRGPNVMRGYAANPEANRSAFFNGWFRTGDQGYFDEEGYLFISGRIKEIINRGGEKIMPREVDEIFLGHPAVFQAVTFAVPHPTLGEDVATAVVLRTGRLISPKELREYAFERLADHKVPSQVVILDQIPKGPTGKQQRIGLAKVLNDKLAPAFVPAQTKVQQAVLGFWKEILPGESFSVFDNFFTCGGDSLSATRLAARCRSVFDIDFPLGGVFRNPTIYEQAEIIEEILIEEMDANLDDEMG